MKTQLQGVWHKNSLLPVFGRKLTGSSESKTESESCQLIVCYFTITPPPPSVEKRAFRAWLDFAIVQLFLRKTKVLKSIQICKRTKSQTERRKSHGWKHNMLEHIWPNLRNKIDKAMFSNTHPLPLKKKNTKHKEIWIDILVNKK